jgi:16S rRNA (guanine527-N7)-methyltransferase
MVTRETSITEGLRRLGLAEFTARAPALAVFAELLDSEAVSIGLVGDMEPDQILSRHLLESCALVRWVRGARSLADVGPGAGLPGLALAILGGTETVLIEPAAAAAGFLRRAAAALGTAARVVQEPAELAARRPDLREAFAVVVSRAVAPPAVALELVLPLAATGGRTLLVTGEAGADRPGLAAVAAELGGAPPVVERLEVPGAGRRTCVIIVDKVYPTPERFPRRPGVPRRRPLGGGVTGVS